MKVETGGFNPVSLRKNTKDNVSREILRRTTATWNRFNYLAEFRIARMRWPRKLIDMSA